MFAKKFPEGTAVFLRGSSSLRDISIVDSECHLEIAAFESRHCLRLESVE